MSRSIPGGCSDCPAASWRCISAQRIALVVQLTVSFSGSFGLWGELIEVCMSTGNAQLACCILTALQATDGESESEVSIGAEALAEVLQILLKYQLDEIEVVLNDSSTGIKLRNLRNVCAYIDEGSRLVRLVGKEIDSRIGTTPKTQ